MYRLSSNRGSVRIVVYGVLVGLGLVAVTLAIFVRLPIGKELIRVLRQDSIAPSQTSVEPESEDMNQDHTPGSIDLISSEQADQENPGEIRLTRSVEVTMGISRIVFEEGEYLTVSGRKNEMFLCDYLGDTVRIPMDAAAWGE